MITAICSECGTAFDVVEAYTSRRMSERERAARIKEVREMIAEGEWMVCIPCQIADTEAENASLDAAESGAGREAILDAQYEREHGGF